MSTQISHGGWLMTFYACRVPLFERHNAQQCKDADASLLEVTPGNQVEIAFGLHYPQACVVALNAAVWF